MKTKKTKKTNIHRTIQILLLSMLFGWMFLPANGQGFNMGNEGALVWGGELSEAPVIELPSSRIPVFYDFSGGNGEDPLEENEGEDPDGSVNDGLSSPAGDAWLAIFILAVLYGIYMRFRGMQSLPGELNR